MASYVTVTNCESMVWSITKFGLQRKKSLRVCAPSDTMLRLLIPLQSFCDAERHKKIAWRGHDYCHSLPRKPSYSANLEPAIKRVMTMSIHFPVINTDGALLASQSPNVHKLTAQGTSRSDPCLPGETLVSFARPRLDKRWRRKSEVWQCHLPGCT